MSLHAFKGGKSAFLLVKTWSLDTISQLDGWINTLLHQHSIKSWLFLGKRSVAGQAPSATRPAHPCSPLRIVQQNMILLVSLIPAPQTININYNFRPA